jgi:hypothetical protein
MGKVNVDTRFETEYAIAASIRGTLRRAGIPGPAGPGMRVNRAPLCTPIRGDVELRIAGDDLIADDEREALVAAATAALAADGWIVNRDSGRLRVSWPGWEAQKAEQNAANAQARQAKEQADLDAKAHNARVNALVARATASGYEASTAWVDRRRLIVFDADTVERLLAAIEGRAS